MRKKEQENLAANTVGNKMEAIIEEEKSEYDKSLISYCPLGFEKRHSLPHKG